jgi:signal transduction histidine kinase
MLNSAERDNQALLQRFVCFRTVRADAMAQNEHQGPTQAWTAAPSVEPGAFSCLATQARMVPLFLQGTASMTSELLPLRWRRPLWIAGIVVLISLLHYSVSVHITVLHELFKRLYYVPVVAAAVLYGVRGGLTTSVLASLLYLPHIVIAWSALPIVELNHYGELVLFNVVGVITGVLADRLHAERDRYQRSALELAAANTDLRAHAEERLRVDRLVTIGRLAAGVAHEIRNPLGGLLGCLEILQSGFPQAHPQHEFLTIARREVNRLDGVVTGFLEFARPPSPSRRTVDLCELVGSIGRLARSSLSRQVELGLVLGRGPIVVEVDPEQLQRAMVNIMLEAAALGHGARLQVSVERDEGEAQVDFEADGVDVPADSVSQLFEPYSSADSRRGLALATARRLIENQGGSVEASVAANTLRCTVRLPISDQLVARSASCTCFAV